MSTLNLVCISMFCQLRPKLPEKDAKKLT